MTARLQGPLIAGLLVLLLASMIICTGIGAAQIPLSDVIGIVFRAILDTSSAGSSRTAAESIVLDLRVPRILLGVLVGGGLAVVGAVLQVMTRNPLADPYLFGISSGASLGAVAILLFAGTILGPYSLQMAAFAGAMLALALVFLFARRSGFSGNERLLLTGVAVHFILMAITNALVMAAPDRGAESALFWMLGSFATAQWPLLPATAFAVALGVLWIGLRAKVLDALALGDEGAHTLGVPVARIRLEMFAATALVTGVLVSMSGAVGFIGLVMPHVGRWLTGAKLARTLPVAGLIGAIFTIWMDAAARAIFAPRELPLGVMTAAIGGIFFLAILRRRNGLPADSQ